MANEEIFIPGGYILLARKIIESEIWKKPPEWFKIWAYLLLRAQHSQYKELKRGQLLTSIPEIQKDTSWMAGNRPCKISRNTIFNFLEWARTSGRGLGEDDANTTMITTTKATHHILIEINNYGLYQTFKNYEHNGDGDSGDGAKAERRRRRHDNINKKFKGMPMKYNDTVSYETVVELFNQNCPSLPRVIDVTPQRKTAIKGFWKWIGQDEHAAIKFFKCIEKSDFLAGRTENTFHCSFDWAIKPANRIKIQEGNYDNRKSGQTISRAYASLMDDNDKTGGDFIDI
ncbi:MAG TPA: hypothetical protein PKA10_19725 [Selenomonadales bacterium]|nr:hypothetical protein [Selenomonadales bacterium]